MKEKLLKSLKMSVCKSPLYGGNPGFHWIFSPYELSENKGQHAATIPFHVYVYRADAGKKT